MRFSPSELFAASRTAGLTVLFFVAAALAWVPSAQARHWVLTPILQNQGEVVAITHAGDDRLFLVSKEGRVWIVRNGVRQSSPYLDIRSRVLYTGESESEQGLLSVAFHPNYQQNGYLFAAYTRSDGVGVVSRFSVTGPNPDQASLGSERLLLEVPQPGPNHNLNHLGFGPDGHLYISSGDGGYQPEPRCTPQQGGNLLGKILRLDVDSNTGSPPFHAIPADNPFLGNPNIRNEIWALGLRNPWRFDFDPDTGDLWLADVGHLLREEVDFLPGGSPGGQNWGFKMMEGFACRGSAANCIDPIPPCFDPAYSEPILDYGHDARHCAVIGGPVYRGAAIPELQGAFLAGDYCGATFLVHRQGGTFVKEDLSEDLFGLIAFGRDAAGEVYLFAAGTLYRLDGLEEDVTLTFDHAEITVAEGAGTLQVPVSRQGDLGTAVSISYRVTEISASGLDFSAADGTLSWPAGNGQDRLIDVAIFDDFELEGNERFSLELFDPVGAELGPIPRTEVVILDDEVGGDCVPSDTVLCLGRGRFRVSVLWRDFVGGTGVGRAVPLDGVVEDPQGFGASGLMSFFRADNVELLVKVLDACGINGHHWVFLAAATSVDYTVEVIDSQTGNVRTYRNPLGVASPATTDINAFACP